METLYSPDLTNNPELYRKLSSVKTNAIKGDSQAREVYMEDYGLTIDDEVVKHITYGEYESFTIYIVDTQGNGKVENLLLSKQPDGSYEASIISYDLTEAEKQSVINGTIPVNIGDKTSLQPLPEESSSSIAPIGSTGIYLDTSTGGCVKPSFDYSGGTIAYTWISVNCPQYIVDNGSGSGGNSGSNSGSNDGNDSGNDTDNGNPPYNSEDPNNDDNPYDGNVGGGSANGDDTSNTDNNNDGNNPDDYTDQIDDCLQTDENGNCIGDITIPIGKNPSNDDPCDILSQATNDTGINNAINNLKTKVNEKKEYGYKITYSYNMDAQEYQYDPVYTTSGDNLTVSFPTGGYIQGFTHNHPKNGIAIPSWMDIHLIYEHEDVSVGLNNNKAFNIIVAKDKESNNEDDTITYAITINDFNTLQTQINFEMNQPKVLRENDPDKKLGIIMEKFGRKFNNIQDDNTALQKKFLETFANYGIDLYKRDENTNTWNKLKLQNNNPVEEPCNN
ncbi:hypothetical protein [Winogradskyella sp. SM1960]|uniref:hypothetical protein n=1 Tax=Winogradskyella sp. SM1960 TaxID=2865955 RepID=UPI001CD3040E|nr:hypothetical protein [Winogradskyella sp. SM1960]